MTFDWLRHDRVTVDLMLNLFRFMAEGSNFLDSHSIFPSETRVAVTSTMTGAPPGAHGVVANQFIHAAPTHSSAPRNGKISNWPSRQGNCPIAGRRSGPRRL
ncbi:MAG: alkaline phosphatase family protein [Candidatus Devosia phytovorans]|uniref:Alkaline phosphatase family protein n=1 Tax=Candidatus Devosia phytovorans TaxID=3121372 RepID=A0AAJ5VY02_9HYPH|nr:alkaline phosphatase family protein [Devosia sp.]WEK06824.1 MAG: alkaline phosphatase family protein [Devosia sp.]